MKATKTDPIPQEMETETETETEKPNSRMAEGENRNCRIMAYVIKALGPRYQYVAHCICTSAKYMDLDYGNHANPTNHFKGRLLGKAWIDGSWR